MGFVFLLFSSHTLRRLACVLFWVFIFSITLIWLISPSFPIIFLWNLIQSFTYVPYSRKFSEDIIFGNFENLRIFPNYSLRKLNGTIEVLKPVVKKDEPGVSAVPKINFRKLTEAIFFENLCLRKFPAIRYTLQGNQFTASNYKV